MTQPRATAAVAVTIAIIVDGTGDHESPAETVEAMVAFEVVEPAMQPHGDHGAGTAIDALSVIAERTSRIPNFRRVKRMELLAEQRPSLSRTLPDADLTPFGECGSRGSLKRKVDVSACASAPRRRSTGDRLDLFAGL
jgi:hypothetical protein